MPKRKRTAATDHLQASIKAAVRASSAEVDERPASTQLKAVKEKSSQNARQSATKTPILNYEPKIKHESERGTPRETHKKHAGASELASAVSEVERDDTPDFKNTIARKRKSKAQKLAEVMPLASRTIGHKLFIGAHVSSAGGVLNAVNNSVHIGANAFALFLKSQRKWANPPLADEHCTGFHANCKEHGYDQAQHVVPHGSYLVNLAHTEPARTTQAYESFVDDLRRCEKLGITLYNFHPGNSVGNDRRAAIEHLASNLNRAHRETSKIVTLLENMAAGGNVLGSTFEDLRDIIALIDDKSRVGVCIDTCHAFAAGYDLRAPEAYAATMARFDELVGFKYLRAMHLNDSKAPFASHRDLHANIGTGYIGLRGFHNVVNDRRLEGLPLVLETPIQVLDEDGIQIKDDKGKECEDKGIWATEIKLLESLVDMRTDAEAFLMLERQLARRGAPERRRLLEQRQRKIGKAEKKLVASTKKGARKRRKENENASESSLTDVESEF